MAGGTREIRRRIISVKNTKKITYAMKLVSAAKLRKAQESVTKSRAYTEAVGRLLGQLVREQRWADFTHPLMETRNEIKSVRVYIIGGSRGLCGAYNTNVNRRTEAAVKELSAMHPGANIELVCIGRKPAEHLRRINRAYKKSFESLGEDANLWPIDDICRELESDFVSGQVDETYIIYTFFKSALTMQVKFDRILPMDANQDVETAGEGTSTGVTLFEPSVKDVFSAIVPRILRSKFRQSCLDAKASEQASRMTAMDAATKNAGDLIQKLTLAYNKLRQSGITSELLDIIGGAEAIN